MRIWNSEVIYSSFKDRCLRASVISRDPNVLKVFLILFNFLVHQMSKYWSVQFHTDTMNHYASRACYILLIFGLWNVVSDSMQCFTFNLKTKFLWKVLSWFSITVHQRDYPYKIWRNPKFHVCSRVLDIYRHSLLKSETLDCLLSAIIAILAALWYLN